MAASEFGIPQCPDCHVIAARPWVLESFKWGEATCRSIDLLNEGSIPSIKKSMGRSVT